MSARNMRSRGARAKEKVAENFRARRYALFVTIQSSAFW